MSTEQNAAIARRYYEQVWDRGNLAEIDELVVRFKFRGAHRGEYRGIAPTGKAVTYTGIVAPAPGKCFYDFESARTDCRRCSVSISWPCSCSLSAASHSFWC